MQTGETPVPPEVRAEAEKSQAKNELSKGLSGLINTKLEGGSTDDKARILGGEEAEKIRQEVKRITEAQELWNKLDRGDSLNVGDKEALKNTLEIWQQEAAQELQKKFKERQDIGLDRLDELEKKYQQLGEEFQKQEVSEISHGIHLDKEAMKLLKEITGTQNEISAIRKKLSVLDNEIDGFRQRLENSQKALDAVEKI